MESVSKFLDDPVMSFVVISRISEALLIFAVIGLQNFKF